MAKSKDILSSIRDHVFFQSEKMTESFNNLEIIVISEMFTNNLLMHWQCIGTCVDTVAENLHGHSCRKFTWTQLQKIYMDRKFTWTQLQKIYMDTVAENLHGHSCRKQGNTLYRIFDGCSRSFPSQE